MELEFEEHWAQAGFGYEASKMYYGVRYSGYLCNATCSIVEETKM
jgi:hypothetical protein